VVKDRSNILSLAMLSRENVLVLGVLRSVSSWHSSHSINRLALGVVFAKGSH
jgi:hypothetical protein